MLNEEQIQNFQNSIERDLYRISNRTDTTSSVLTSSIGYNDSTISTGFSDNITISKYEPVYSKYTNYTYDDFRKLAKEACPYPKDSIQAKIWEEGFIDAYCAIFKDRICQDTIEEESYDSSWEIRKKNHEEHGSNSDSNNDTDENSVFSIEDVEENSEEEQGDN